MNQRPYTPDMLNPVIDLLLDYRSAGYVHHYPTVWRLRQLIDSRLWDASGDTRLWEDTADRLCGFALLWKRQPDSPYFGLERVLHPQYASSGLSGEMLEWAVHRANQTGSSVWVLLLEMDTNSDVALLESKGFSRLTWDYNVYMTTSLTDVWDSTTLPEGYTLTSLQESELEQYQSIYGFTAVSIAHQRELLRQPEYRHFVLKTPEKTLAGYLECSFSRIEWQRSGKRIGWIDYIGILPDFQRRGFGEALMRQGFVHLRSEGADTAMLITASSNAEAQALFKKVGMTIAAEDYVYSYTPSATGAHCHAPGTT